MFIMLFPFGVLDIYDHDSQRDNTPTPPGKNNSCQMFLQGGPLPVINGVIAVIAPKSLVVITPVKPSIRPFIGVIALYITPFILWLVEAPTL